MRRDMSARAWSVIGLLALSGCAFAPPTVQEYPESCEAPRPTPPVCLSEKRIEDPVVLRACGTGLDNYLDALDRHAACRTRQLTGAMDTLRARAEEVVDCYVLRYRSSAPDAASRHCGIVSMPSESFSDVPSGLDYHFGVPRCVRHAPSLPRDDLSATLCHEDVRRFVESETRYQIDSYRSNIEADVRRTGDAAVRRFTCLSRGQGACP